MSRRSGPPYRDTPSTPSPNIRTKANYSIVIISHSGGARQIEVTPAKVRLGAALAAGALLVSGVTGVLAGRHIFTSGPGKADIAALTEKVQSLQQELTAKDNAIAAQEERLKEIMEKRPRPVSSTDPAVGPSRVPDEVGVAEPEDDTHVTPSQLRAGLHVTPPEPARSKGEPVPVESRDGQERRAVVPNAPPEALHPDRPAPRASTRPTMRFNAEDVTSISGTPFGKLEFRLVKDVPESQFDGFLFLYLTTTDKKGEEKTHLYPEKIRLDGEMPRDYRDGMHLSFKRTKNLRFEYPRQEATILAGASILLYNADGQIVLQRALDRSEIKILHSKERGPKPPQHSGTRRRAL